jgi:hypothetical protein
VLAHAHASVRVHAHAQAWARTRMHVYTAWLSVCSGVAGCDKIAPVKTNNKNIKSHRQFELLIQTSIWL